MITIFIIFLAVTSSLNFVTAQNETETRITNSEEEERIGRSDDTVESLESGNFNISFEDGYNGYCINYGKHDAEIGDSFTLENTSHATNSKTGEDIGNYLKVYFVDYYDHTLKDKIVTQHTIWHFSDDFNGWRLDYDLIDNIKATALTKTIPDYGAVKKINNTTEAVFDFKVLKSGSSENQNFFAYKITYRDIINEILKNNESETNSTEDLLENSTTDKNITEPENTNTTEIGNSNNTAGNSSNSIIIPQNSNEIDRSTEDGREKVNLSKHVTGHSRTIGLIMLMILLCIVAIKYIRYYK